MEDRRYVENKNWVEKVFQVCGVMQPPGHLVAHYSECLTKGTITYEQAQNEILSLSKGPSMNAPVNKPLPSGPDSKLDKVKEYVDQLYLNYTGAKGDPASTNYLVNSIMHSDFSLTQAEYFVKFSKEAKLYAKKKATQQEERLAQIQQFVRELFRVYARNPSPSPEEIQEYAVPLTTGERTLQEVEDEFKLLALSPPS